MTFSLSNDSKSIEHDALDIIAHDHQRQMQLCDLIERIADGLPGEIDRRLCGEVAASLQYDLPLHHRDEEIGLYPLMRGRGEQPLSFDLILDHLISEHGADTALASEVAEVLDALSRDGKSANPEMVGYMLRGFFEGYRRHICWETMLIMPLARRCLRAEDLAVLAHRMAQNRKA